MENNGGWSAFVPLIIMTIPIIWASYQLAKDKGMHETFTGISSLMLFLLIPYGYVRRTMAGPMIARFGLL